MKVRIEELQGLLGPEDVDVDLIRILKEARDGRGRKIFETFSSDGPKVMPTFDTKILRSDIFAQVNLISVAPTLQN